MCAHKKSSKEGQCPFLHRFITSNLLLKDQQPRCKISFACSSESNSKRNVGPALSGSKPHNVLTPCQALHKEGPSPSRRTRYVGGLSFALKLPRFPVPLEGQARETRVDCFHEEIKRVRFHCRIDRRRGEHHTVTLAKKNLLALFNVITSC